MLLAPSFLRQNPAILVHVLHLVCGVRDAHRSIVQMKEMVMVMVMEIRI